MKTFKSVDGWECEIPDVPDDFGNLLGNLHATKVREGTDRILNYKEASRILFGKDADISTDLFEKFCTEKMLVLNSRRANVIRRQLAIYALIHFLACSGNTTVIIASVHQDLLWKEIKGLWDKVPINFRDGVSEFLNGCIYGKHSGQVDEFSGIFCKTRTDDMIGRVNKRILFITDELGDLSPNLVAMARDCLTKNVDPRFIMVGEIQANYEKLLADDGFTISSL